MSFSVNGVTFNPGSAFDHATSMLNYMNSLLQGLNLPTLLPNNSNALWWTLLGQGSFDAQMDLIVMQAANSLNVSTADDVQLVNLLPIAGTQLIPPSYSVVTLLATASSGILFIPSGTNVPYSAYQFITQTPLTVPVSGSGSVTAICNTAGPITVLPGSINLSSITGINNLANITNQYAAIPGNNVETPAQARARILQGKNIGVGIDGVITALRSLVGIGQANVFWNYLPSGYISMSGLANGLPPRTAWIIVQNNVPGIASTYLQYMTLPTSGVGFTPAQQQNYVFQSGQNFPVNFDLCQYQQIYATVYLDQNKVLQNGYATIIYNTLTTLNSQFLIGQRVSSEQLSVALANLNVATPLGVTLSLTPSGTYGQAVQPAFNSIPFLASGGIYIVLQ